MRFPPGSSSALMDGYRNAAKLPASLSDDVNSIRRP